MKLKALSQAVIAASLVSGATLAQAEEEKGFEIAGNIALVTDYRFRGVSQTDGGPAVQGGFDVEHKSGLYAGVWGSNIDFGPGVDASMEIDYYVGIAGDITDKVSYDAGWIWYDYPQGDGNSGGVAQNLDYYEWYASVSTMGVTLGMAYTPEFTADLNSYNYYYVDYSVGLPQDISLDLHYGISDYDDSANGNGGDGDNGFGSEHDDDWSVGLSKDLFGVSFGLSWVDTNIGKTACGGTNNCSGQVVFSISKSL